MIMAHLYRVYDTDVHFEIDATSRVIKNSGKSVLIQGDHRSERFTFEVPRTVDGHDLSECNVVQVHYINVDHTIKSNVSKDVYEVDDLQVSPDGDDVVICSWLVDGNATKYAGTLDFALKFKCVSDGVTEYVWNTEIFSGIRISAGIDNGDAVAEGYSDILEAWRLELIASGGVTDERIEQAVEDYMAEHPIEVPDCGGSAYLTTAQIEALDGMFKMCAYTGDASNVYRAFKTAFGIGGSGGGTVEPDEPDTPEVITYTITSGLTNVISTRPSAVVNKGENYIATLTAADGYAIETVTVTMGGVDITATAYASGVVNIASVTGNVVVTASAVLSESGDDDNGDELGTPVYTANFNTYNSTSPETQNLEVIDGKVVCNSSKAKLLIKKDVPTLANKTLVVEFGECERQGTAHGRLICWNAGSEGFIFRSTGFWGIYTNGAWVMTENNNPNIISNNVVKVYINESMNRVKVTAGDEVLIEADITISYDNQILMFSGDNAYYNAVVKTINMYEGDV